MKKLVLITGLALLEMSTGVAQTLLYDQTQNITTGGILCRKHDQSASFIYDTDGADDFIVPAGETWSIDSFIVEGTYNGFIPPALVPTIVTIYDDNNGSPGNVVFVDTVADGDPDDDQDLEPYLPSGISLSAGTYWFSVKIYTSSVPWYWLRINEEYTENSSHWQNPGGGYAVCTSWTELYNCIAGQVDSSYNFKIYGCLVSGEANITPGDTLLCEGESTTISVASTYAQSNFMWDNGSTGASIQTDSTGAYSVTVDNGAAACDVQVVLTSYVEVVDVTQPELSDTFICESSLPFVYQTPASGCNNCISIWTDSSSSVFFPVYEAGTVTLTILDTVSGCFKSASAELSVDPSQATIQPGTFLDVCDGDELTLNTAQAFASYTWQQFDGLNWITFSQLDSAVTGDSGAVAVSAYSVNDCYATDTAYVLVRALPEPSIVGVTEAPSGNVKLSASPGYLQYAWSNGKSGADITITSNGTYTVTVTDEYGCEGSEFYVVYTVGVNDLIAERISFYPNPATDFVTFTWPSNWVGASNVVIFDLQGKVAKRFAATEAIQNVDLSDLSNGQYMIKFTTPEGEGHASIVVSK